MLVVVSVVLALSAPWLRGFFASRQTADAATTVLSLTQWARSQAVAQGRPYRLNVDSSSGTYWLTAQQAGAYVAPDSDMGRHFHLPEGATAQVRPDSTEPAQPAESAKDYLQFYPSGRNDPGSIEIVGRQGEVYLVSAPSATEPFRVISPSEAP